VRAALPDALVTTAMRVRSRRTCLKLAHQIGLRLKRARHHHQAGRFLVEPMDDTGARQAGRGVAIAVQQTVQDRAAPVTGCRMHDHAGRLVDNHQRVVFVDDVERHRLGRERELLRQQVGHELDGRAERHRLTDFGRLAVDAHPLRLDPALQPVT
jgi:hypothetical protein